MGVLDVRQILKGKVVFDRLEKDYALKVGLFSPTV